MHYFLIYIATVVLMEGITWLTHKFVMHGFLWYLHQDHHKKNPNSILEKNDAFFVIFAIPSIACIYFGTYSQNFGFLLPIGLGIMTYGAFYFLVHEAIIHKRVLKNMKLNFRYFNGLRKAHKAHHSHLEKIEGECFGMLLVPLKYFKD